MLILHIYSYLQMISTAKDGGTVTNYSPRFTITGLTGTTNAKYVEQVNELGGTTSGPDTVNDVVPKAAPVPVASVAPALPAGFDVPYNKQTGPTKYAPMQPVPPTKITAQGKPTPLFPASSFNIAKGKLPPAQAVISTVTASQTFSVHSIENTVCVDPSSNLNPGSGGRLMIFVDRCTEQSERRHGEIFG